MAPIEVTVEEVRALLDTGEPIVLLDVRRPEEHAHVNIGGVLIPLHELPERLGELAGHLDAHVIAYCHHGVRSLHAAQLLRENGFEHAQSMSGGIDAWSLRIDPSKPRY